LIFFCLTLKAKGFQRLENAIINPWNSCKSKNHFANRERK